jgi:hypothetical protein
MMPSFGLVASARVPEEEVKRIRSRGGVAYYSVAEVPDAN